MTSAALLFGLALLFLNPVVQRYLQTRDALREGRMRVSALIGIVLLLLALAGPAITSFLSPALAASIAEAGTDFHVWMALYFLAFAYYTYSEFALRRERDRRQATIEASVDSFRLAIEKWAVPRRLTKVQTKVIEAALQQSEPHTISIVSKTGDDEAIAYGYDLVRAVTNGGWTVLQSQSAELPSGLKVTYPPQTGPGPEAHHPSAEQVLLAALEAAEVPLDGGTGGAGSQVIISIGQRRRDMKAAAHKWTDIDDYF